VQASRSQKKSEVLTVHLEIRQEGDRNPLRIGPAEASSLRPLSSRKRSRREKVRRLDAPGRDVSESLSLELHVAGHGRRQLAPGEWARESRLKQGLPPVVTDPLVLHNIKTIMRAAIANPEAEVIPLKPRAERLTRRLDIPATTSRRTPTQRHPDQPPGDVAL
jgi:hypothetical protein